MVLTDEDDDTVEVPRLDMSKPYKAPIDVDLENLRAAYQRVANFPENDPQGMMKMLDLRKAVEKYLETR